MRVMRISTTRDRLHRLRGQGFASASDTRACSSLKGSLLNGSLLQAAGAAFLALCFVLVLANSGFSVPAPPGRTPRIAALFADVNSPFGIADFDGDRLPDLATVRVGRVDSAGVQYRITFQLGVGARQTLEVSGPYGEPRVQLRDADGDNSLDVVVTAAGLRRPLAILLNDGHGRFRRADHNVLHLEEIPGFDVRFARGADQTRDKAVLPGARFSVAFGGEESKLPRPAQLRPSLYRTPFVVVSCFTYSDLSGRAPPAFPA
jgi:hypothetical protein